MSIERIVLAKPDNGHEKESSSSPEEEIDNLIEQLPPELHGRWYEEIEGLDDHDAVGLLRSVVERRRQSRLTPLLNREPGSQESVHESDSGAELLRDRVLESGQVLGSGKVADFFSDPINHFTGYKVVRDRGQYALCNSIVQEAEYLDALSDFSHAGIRSPRPYSTVVAPGFVALGMERLPGMSLEQMHTLPEKPKNFDMEEYFKAMHAYVEELGSKYGIYHRDLRAGNLMFDPESGSGFVIDFGRAVHAYPDEHGFLTFKLNDRQVRSRNLSAEQLEYVKKQFIERFQ